MATLGSAPAWYGWEWYGTNNHNQAFTDTFTMPEDGFISDIVFYAESHSGTTTFEGVVWASPSGAVLAVGSALVLGAGSQAAGGQAWQHSPPASPVYLPAGTAIRIGWWRAESGSMLFSEGHGGNSYTNQTNGGVGDTSVATKTSFGAIGAYIVYTPVGPPGVATRDATAITATTATINGNVDDGGFGAAGGGSSTYGFQWSTDPGLAGYSQVTGSFTGAPAEAAALTGLTPSTTYYYRVFASNVTGATYGAIFSFTTLASTSLAPTLLTPSDGAVVNLPVSGATHTWTYHSGGAPSQTGYALQYDTNPLTGAAGPVWWNGAGWSNAPVWNVSSASAVTIPAGYFLVPGNYHWTVATADANGHGPYASPSFTIVSVGPPLAPTLTAPPTGVAADLSGTPTFTWTPHSSNAPGGQTAWAFERRVHGTGAWTYWNASSLTWVGAPVWNSGTVGSATFPAHAWAYGITYDWSVATQDSGGRGPFAAPFTVLMNLVPGRAW